MLLAVGLSFFHPLIQRTSGPSVASQTGRGWVITVYFLVVARSLIGVIFPEESARTWAVYAFAAFVIPPILMAMVRYFVT